VIDIFPMAKGDSRPMASVLFGDPAFSPLDHLSFYARYCAFRNRKNIDLFFQHFTAFWIAFLNANRSNISPDRADLRSISFFMKILGKCVIMNPKLLNWTTLRELFLLLQEAMAKLPFSGDSARSVRRFLNGHLSVFYKDMANLPRVSLISKSIVVDLIEGHLEALKMIAGRDGFKSLILEFFSWFLSPATLILLCAKRRNGCLFSLNLIPFIQQNLMDLELTGSILKRILNILRCFDSNSLRELIPGLFPLVLLYGKFTSTNPKALVGSDENKSPCTYLINPFVLILSILARSDLTTLPPEVFYFVGRILEIADREAEMIGKPGNENPWQTIRFCAQQLTVCLISLKKAFECYNHLILPAFQVKFSHGLITPLITNTRTFLETYSNELYKNRRAQTYKFVKYLVAHLVKERVPILDLLWKLEERAFNSHGRCLAFFLRSLYQRSYCKSEFRPLDPKFPTILKGSQFESVSREFKELWENLTRLMNKLPKLIDLPVHLREEIADRLLALADFFHPSPDVRIHILLNLATLHKMHRWPAETAIAYFHAGALIAEVLSTTSFMGISAESFLNACPSALSEAAFTKEIKVIRDRTPKLIGFCDSQYFTEAALFAMVKDGVEVCRAANFFRISHRGVSLLLSLMQTRGLSKLYQRTLESIAQLIKEEVAAGVVALETFWLTIFDDGNRYIHHESGFTYLPNFEGFIKERAKCVAGGRKVVVIQQGHELDPKAKTDKEFRVLIRKVDPYFTDEENQNNRSVFERSFGAVRFSYDIAKKDGGAHRTIITLSHGLPYLNSRVLIPENGIKIMDLKPIVVSCLDLKKKINTLNDAIDVGEIRVLQPQIKGTLMTEVNDGWHALADQFLQGKVEDENTLEMRRLFSQLLETLERAVEFHGKDPVASQLPLHLMFCPALEQMRVAMRPLIGPQCKLPSSK
jgi:hypothetical protein